MAPPWSCFGKRLHFLKVEPFFSLTFSLLSPFFSGVLFRSKKKVENSTPRGTFFLNNHVYETVPLGHWGTKIVPLRVPYYGQSNSAPRGTISVPFLQEYCGQSNKAPLGTVPVLLFLSVCIIQPHFFIKDVRYSKQGSHLLWLTVAV